MSVWGVLCKAYEVVVPATIVRTEVYHYEDLDGRRRPLDILPFVHDGTITEYSASVVEIAETRRMLHPDLASRIHAGELEALTWLRLNDPEGVAFVSADGMAIEATVALDRNECAMSLESALRKCGLTKPLPYEHCDAFVERKVREGSVRKVQGRALAPQARPADKKRGGKRPR